MSQSELEKAEAANARLLEEIAEITAQRDAAISRNIHLQEELSDAKTDRIPVASWCLTVLNVFNELEDKLHADCQVWEALRTEDNNFEGPGGVNIAEEKLKFMNEIIEKIRGLPGWQGNEGNVPSMFVLRDVAVQVVEEMEKIVQLCEIGALPSIEAVRTARKFASKILS